MKASIVIRTLNEEKYLGELLRAIESQETGCLDYEVIVVDSGSDDNSVKIANAHKCTLVYITREEFSFGRALNRGCQVAQGDFIVMISGHCVPVDDNWLYNLCAPLIQKKADYSYGRQLGGSNSHYSECQIFSKYYPAESKTPQHGFFCNNANSAITRKAWEKYRFDEQLTGLEDMELAKRLVNDSGCVAYIGEAAVYHYHDEQWHQIKRRFERESIALQQIMPQVHIYPWDLTRYIITSIWLDWKAAVREGVFINKFFEVMQYRFFQYWGSYVGNHDHRKLSHSQKETYFYPTELRREHEP